jgi:hypothetical protein
MSRSQEERFDHVVVGAGLSGLITFEKLSGSKVILEATDILGGRFSSGLHVMKEAAAEGSKYLKIVETLKPIKIRWDRSWVEPQGVDWGDAGWKGVSLSTWEHYFSTDLCRVEFNSDAVAELRASDSLRIFEPVVELGLGEGEGAWVLKGPKSCITTSQVHWCAGLMAFQNAVGKHASQKFLGENTLPSQSDKDFRGGFAINWTIPNSGFAGKTELDPEVAAGGLFGIPVKHGGAYLLMILHLSILKSEIEIKTLTYAHEDVLRDPKESLSLQKSLKRGLKMLFVDQNAVDMHATSEKLIVDQRLLGASRGLTWLLAPQPDIGLHFAGEEALFDRTPNNPMGLSRAAESVESAV